MNKITLHTDAGCAHGKGGFAFLLRFSNKTAKQFLGYGTTMANSALFIELVAIKRALEFIHSLDLPEYEIELCCDVLSIINFFKDSAYKNYFRGESKSRYRKFIKSNLDLLNEIIRLIESIKIDNIRFVKVKSKKDEFNKLVHNYASFARNICLTGNESSYIFELNEISGISFTHDIT